MLQGRRKGASVFSAAVQSVRPTQDHVTRRFMLGTPHQISVGSSNQEYSDGCGV